jgi:hypothetical protein
MHGTGRVVTTDNFFTNCKLADFLLTKNMRLVSTVRKNKPEIQALFFTFGFTSDLTLVSYAPARNKTISLLSSQHHGETCMDEEIYLKPEITVQCNATKSGADNLDKLLKEYMHTRSARCWPWKLLLNLIVVYFIMYFYCGC